MNGTVLGILSLNSLIFRYRSNISIILSHRVTTYLIGRRGVDILSSADMIGDFNFVIILFTFSIMASSFFTNSFTARAGNRTFRQRRFGKKKSRRFGKFFCRNVRRHVFAETSFAETSCSPLGYVPISSSAPRPLGADYMPILLSQVEQEQRPSGNGDREAIVVGAGLCDGEGERAYIAYIMRDVSTNFSA